MHLLTLAFHVLLLTCGFQNSPQLQHTGLSYYRMKQLFDGGVASSDDNILFRLCSFPGGGLRGVTSFLGVWILRLPFRDTACFV